MGSEWPGWGLEALDMRKRSDKAEKCAERRDDPWVFIVEGQLDPRNGWHADGSWMMLEGIDPPEEVEAMKAAAVEEARKRQLAMLAGR